MHKDVTGTVIEVGMTVYHIDDYECEVPGKVYSLDPDVAMASVQWRGNNRQAPAYCEDLLISQ